MSGKVEDLDLAFLGIEEVMKDDKGKRNVAKRKTMMIPQRSRKELRIS